MRTNRERVILPSSRKNTLFIDQSAFSNFAIYVIIDIIVIVISISIIIIFIIIIIIIIIILEVEQILCTRIIWQSGGFRSCKSKRTPRISKKIYPIMVNNLDVICWKSNHIAVTLSEAKIST